MKFCSLPAKHLGPHRCDADHASGHCNAAPSHYYRDKLPCPGCGFVAIRQVSDWDGKKHVSPCTICNAESRAETYANLSVMWSNRAKVMRTKRLATLLKKEKLATLKEQS